MNPDPSQPNDPKNANVDSTMNENPSNKKLKCTKNDWTREEDLVLAKGWLHVSEENITSYSQRKKDFWRSITAYYESNNTSGIPRTLKKIKGHWHYMNPQIVAFNNQFLVLKKEHDDWCRHDCKSAAQDKYYAIHGSYFRHEHVWDLVKDEPQWISCIKSENSRVSYDYQTHINVGNNVFSVHPNDTNLVPLTDTNLAKEARKARCLARKARLACESQTHINVDDNVDVHTVGTNIAKEAPKEKSTPTSSSSKSRHEIVEKHVEDYKKVIERHYTLKEKNIRVEEEKLKIEENKLKNKEIAILFMNPEKMADFARQVWRNRCDEIKEKYNL